MSQATTQSPNFGYLIAITQEVVRVLKSAQRAPGIKSTADSTTLEEVIQRVLNMEKEISKVGSASLKEIIEGAERVAKQLDEVRSSQKTPTGQNIGHCRDQMGYIISEIETSTR